MAKLKKYDALAKCPFYKRVTDTKDIECDGFVANGCFSQSTKVHFVNEKHLNEWFNNNCATFPADDCPIYEEQDARTEI